MIKYNLFKNEPALIRPHLKIVLYLILMLAFIHGIGFVFMLPPAHLMRKRLRKNCRKYFLNLIPVKVIQIMKIAFIDKIKEFIKWLMEKINPSKLFRFQKEITISEGASEVLAIVAAGLILLILGLICYFIFRNFKNHEG